MKTLVSQSPPPNQSPMRANQGYTKGCCGCFARRRATAFPTDHSCHPISATIQNNPNSSGILSRIVRTSSARLTPAARAAICHAVGTGIQRMAHGRRLAAVMNCANRAAALWAIDRALTAPALGLSARCTIRRWGRDRIARLSSRYS